MRETKTQRIARLFQRLTDLGLCYAEADALRRIEMTLSRWSEAECGESNDHCSWAIERDEAGVPYHCVYPHQGKSYKTKCRDKEKGALARLQRIMAAHPTLWAYHQTDPRGCSLYVGRIVDLMGQELPTAYTRGVAVCL